MAWVVVTFSAALEVSSAFAQIQHGTVLITLFSHEGIVMASDGLEIADVTTGDPQKPFRTVREEAEAKIAVCNKSFVCGSAGADVINLPDPVNIKYHFQEWLPITKTKTTSVRDYAKIIQNKARVTFKKMDIAIKQADFWKSHIGGMSGDFVVYGIAGYDGKTPQLCIIPIKISPDNRRLLYDDILCQAPQWTSPTSTIRIVISGHEKDIGKAATAGTSEAARLAELLPAAGATAKTLFPDAPPSLSNVIAWAAGVVELEGKLHPEQFGRTTRIGVLIDGKLPTVLKFVNH
jgi:hypothetical protein